MFCVRGEVVGERGGGGAERVRVLGDDLPGKYRLLKRMMRSVRDRGRDV